jgi:protein tyrosine/serine phosphatase
MPCPRLRYRKPLTILGAVLLLGVVLAGGHVLLLMASGNVAVVIPGECYRSAQPSREMLVKLVGQHGIRSVINLRGEMPTNDWYQEEIAACRELSLAHFDVRLSARRDWTDAEVDELVDVLQRAPKPMLIHCKSGSDRTGVAAAMFIALREGAMTDHARGQLSFRYGHLSIPFIAEYAMDRELEQFSERLKTISPQAGTQ